MQVDLKPSAEIHRIRNERHSNVSQIAGCVPRRNVQAPTERNRQMCEIATNSDPFSERLERRAIRTSSLIVELKMSMNKIANRLDPFPSRSGSPKVKPGKVH